MTPLLHVFYKINLILEERYVQSETGFSILTKRVPRLLNQYSNVLACSVKRAHKTSLTPPLIIEVPVPSQEIK